jgi:hypothetical protein
VRRIEAVGFLHPIARLGDAALPSLMRKCVRMASGARGSVTRRRRYGE